jgi:selT/selW/selH-like putative selenoprotein
MIWLGGIVGYNLAPQIFTKLNINPHPAWYNKMKENSIAWFFGLFMFNNLGTSLLSSGAFEIYIDGALIYSKLKTGRPPNQHDVLEAFNMVNYDLSSLVPNREKPKVLTQQHDETEF